jgi:anti-sigma regulatory factor (Ser/Thr protein kinase)
MASLATRAGSARGSGGLSPGTSTAEGSPGPSPGVGAGTHDIAMMASASVLGSLTIPGRPEHVCAARSFVEKALGGASPATDAAVLLVSETVTNAVLHSNSRRRGGTVTITIIDVGGGTRVEVTDDGSEVSAPVVKGDGCVSGGHGLFLVQTLADQWGYLRDDAGTTVWFWLSGPA